MRLKKGQWVRSYSTGIWQIYRVLKYTRADPTNGNEVPKTTIFSKRFVSNSYRRSFKEECCAPELVSPLNAEELSELNHFIAENEDLYRRFMSYTPKPLDCVYNARIGIPANSSAESVEALLSSDRLIRETDIGQYLEDKGLDTSAFPYWTAQFLSSDHECKDGQLAYHFSRILT